MSDGEDIIPIWNWYRDRILPSRLVRAMHMTKKFSYTNPNGNHSGHAGDWLVEQKDGSWPQAMNHVQFHAIYEVCPNPRPETIMQPESLGGPEQVGAPEKEVV